MLINQTHRLPSGFKNQSFKLSNPGLLLFHFATRLWESLPVYAVGKSYMYRDVLQKAD